MKMKTLEKSNVSVKKKLFFSLESRFKIVISSLQCQDFDEIVVEMFQLSFQKLSCKFDGFLPTSNFNFTLIFLTIQVFKCSKLCRIVDVSSFPFTTFIKSILSWARRQMRTPKNFTRKFTFFFIIFEMVFGHFGNEIKAKR
jgi:hypothetical protein